MTIISTAAGVLLILVVAREVFHSLFHPSGQGLTSRVFQAVWALSGRAGRRARMLSGPVSMVLVIGLWVGLLVVGWALVYLPALPESFIFASSLEPRSERDFVDALYYAWVTQSTLGYGDIAPEDGLFRVLAPLQATLGFGLLTMVVTWVLSVYPALQRQRAAASLAHALRRSHEQRGESAADLHPTTLARQLERLATMLNSVRTDFTQYPSTFYFAAPATTLSLAAALPFVVSVAEADGYTDETRPAAAELKASLELFAAALAEQHLDVSAADRDEVLRAYRRHQGVAEPP